MPFNKCLVMLFPRFTSPFNFLFIQCTENVLNVLISIVPKINENNEYTTGCSLYYRLPVPLSIASLVFIQASTLNRNIYFDVESKNWVFGTSFRLSGC